MTWQLRCTVCDHGGPAPRVVAEAAAAAGGASAEGALPAVLARVRCTKCGARGAAELVMPRAKPRPLAKERFVGAGLNVVSDPVYHRPTCKWVARMNVGEVVEFGSRVDAEFRGYRACKVCNP